jgi:hypothetical protein
MTQYKHLVQARRELLKKEKQGNEVYQLLWDKEGSHTYYMNGKIVTEKDNQITVKYQKSRLEF